LSQNSITSLHWFELAIKGDFFCGNVMWEMLDCFFKKIQKRTKIWKKCRHFSTATKKFVPTPHFAAVEREF